MKIKDHVRVSEMQEKIQQLPDDQREEAETTLWNLAELLGLIELTEEDLPEHQRVALQTMRDLYHTFLDRRDKRNQRYPTFVGYSGLLFSIVASCVIAAKFWIQLDIGLTLPMMVVGFSSFIITSLFVSIGHDRRDRRMLHDKIETDPSLQESLRICSTIKPSLAREIQSEAMLPVS